MSLNRYKDKEKRRTYLKQYAAEHTLSKDVRQKYSKRYYIKNKTKILQRQKKWDIIHKEKRQQRNKTYRENNKEYYTNYRLRHKDKRKDYDTQYRKNNQKRRTFWNSQRRINKKKVGGFHTLGEWETLKAQYDWTCPSCGLQEPHIHLTEDHIIPISKGGSNNIENIQPLCRSCNSKKGTKIQSFEKLQRSK